MSIHNILEVDFNGGFICYDKFNIDFSVIIKDQELMLDEDLLQVKYDNGRIIDLGWYPSFDVSGSFRVYVINEFDWDKPLFSKKAINKYKPEYKRNNINY